MIKYDLFITIESSPSPMLCYSPDPFSLIFPCCSRLFSCLLYIYFLHGQILPSPLSLFILLFIHPLLPAVILFLDFYPVPAEARGPKRGESWLQSSINPACNQRVPTIMSRRYWKYADYLPSRRGKPFGSTLS